MLRKLSLEIIKYDTTSHLNLAEEITVDDLVVSQSGKQLLQLVELEDIFPSILVKFLATHGSQTEELPTCGKYQGIQLKKSSVNLMPHSNLQLVNVYLL